MKKIISKTIFIFVLLGLISATGKKEDISTLAEPNSVTIAALLGPSSIGMANLFINHPNLGDKTIVSFEVLGSVDALVPKLLNGDVDIGILPPNVAAKLYNLNKNSVVVGAIVENSMLALITRDTNITKLADLSGKTVAVVGQGSTPEYVFRTLIAKEGMPKDSILLDFSLPANEVGAALISNKIDYAIVPEPFATIAISNGATGDHPVRRAFLLRDLWKNNNLGSDFPMTLCVIRTEFAKKYPETVRKFLASYKESIYWTLENPLKAGEFVERATLGLKAPIAAKAIPFCNYVYIPALDGRKSVEDLFLVFLKFAPESIGGKLPDEGFYFHD